MREEALSGALQGMLVRPDALGQDAVGALVLHGSSGQVASERARLLAGEGALALALRWFGGPGQPPGICEIPLEGFVTAIDRLQAEGARRISVVGVSKGAEAALLLACRDPRVASVVAIAPTSVVWANVGPGSDGLSSPYRSSWSWRGESLPFGPYDDTWTPVALADGRIAYRTLYEQSLRAFPAEADAARIPIEQARADLLLIAGGDDQLWPSSDFAAELIARRQEHRRQVEFIVGLAAGHRPYFPGESAPEPSARLAHGGTTANDAALGARAWPRVLAHLGLKTSPFNPRSLGAMGSMEAPS